MMEIYPLQTAAASLFTRLTGRPGPRPEVAFLPVVPNSWPHRGSSAFDVPPRRAIPHG